jgi:hypothetical protein
MHNENIGFCWDQGTGPASKLLGENAGKTFEIGASIAVSPHARGLLQGYRACVLFFGCPLRVLRSSVIMLLP